MWTRTNPRHEETYGSSLASGFIAGEALLAVIIPVLIFLGAIRP